MAEYKGMAKVIMTRTARINARGGHHQKWQWELLVQHYCPDNICLSCGRKITGIWPIVYSKDHVVSIQQGGSDTIDNIQPICLECNRDKGWGGKVDFRPDQGEYARSILEMNKIRKG